MLKAHYLEKNKKDSAYFMLLLLFITTVFFISGAVFLPLQNKNRISIKSTPCFQKKGKRNLFLLKRFSQRNLWRKKSTINKLYYILKKNEKVIIKNLKKVRENKRNVLKIENSGASEVPLQNYRNIGIIAHIDAGKTTTTERILYYTNVIKKIGEVHEGMSTMDYLDIEKEKGITINAAVTTCYWNGSDKNLENFRINIIDTPGHVDFTAEVEKSLRVLDGGIVVFDSSEGVEAQSETVWKQANRYNISRIIFLNKLDKVGADFNSCIEEIKRKLNKKILILYVPIFIMNEFSTTIDVLREKVITYKNFHDFVYEDIPKPFYDIFLKYKNLLFEEIAENFHSFLNNYLNDTVMSIEEIEHYIRKLVIEKKYNVVICGSSLKNKNVHMLLDMVVKYLPSPIDSVNNYKKQVIYKYDVNKKGEKVSVEEEHIDSLNSLKKSEDRDKKEYGEVTDVMNRLNVTLPNDFVKEKKNESEKAKEENNQEKEEKEEKEEKKEKKINGTNAISTEVSEKNVHNLNRKFVGLIYKIMNDQHLGNINYVRIYEGSISKGDFIYNNRTKKNEKISKIFFIHSNEKHELSKAKVGDIVAIVGLKDTKIGDTITNIYLRAQLKKIKEIPPIISFYIYNKNKNEYEKLINALIKIKKEDHSFFFHINQDTKDLIISGVGELHLQIIVNKIQNDFNIPIVFGKPQISYKETFVQTVEARGKYIKQSGGRGQYGDVYIKIEPMYNYSKEEEEEEEEDVEKEAKNIKNEDQEQNLQDANSTGTSKIINGNETYKESYEQENINSMNINTAEVNSNIIIKNEITCGAIPSEYFDAINTGIREQCNLGVISNSPIINIIVTILDGSFHSVDSSEHAFKLAAQLAIREAARKTSLRLLEPIMNLNVSVPSEYLGEVISDLVKKRGRILHVDESDEEVKDITARVPMASILSYVSDLRKITKGRGNYTMTLYKYSLVPEYIQEQILQKRE